MSKQLTWEQKRIVEHMSGHALVKAVPGSGKTTTLVKRVEKLVKQGVDPQSILVLMYNKAAQESFSEKLKQVLRDIRNPDVRTFHSLALEIVRKAERQHLINKKELLTNQDTRYDLIIKEAYRKGFNYDLDYIPTDAIEELELFITRCRVSDVSPQDALDDPEFSQFKPEFIKAYGVYAEILDTYNFRTFDDALSEAISLLRKKAVNAPTLTHIIVDEYQDVNLIQHAFIRLLTGAGTSVMVVGDVNQCIYEWRGARPDFINGLFEQHFNNTRVFHLSCTFRFGHALSLMANSVIRRNAIKLTKLCVSHPSTPQTVVHVHMNHDLPAVLGSLSTGTGTQGILSRTKANLAEAELALRLLGIPYRYLDGSTSLHTRSEVGLLVIVVMLGVYGNLTRLEGISGKKQLLFGFLKESGFPWKQGQLKEALNALSAPSVDVGRVLRDLFEDNTEHKNKLKTLTETFSTYQDDTPAVDIIRHLRQHGFLSDLGSTGVQRKAANDVKRGFAHIDDLLETTGLDAKTFISLILDPATSSNTDAEPLVLSTLHGSKGLEWDNVVLIGLSEKEFLNNSDPDTSSRYERLPKVFLETVVDDDIEEERRLFYVGITRAKQTLSLVVPHDKGLALWLEKGWDSSPKKTPIASRFVYESGVTACQQISNSLYTRTTTVAPSKLQQWYVRDLERLKV